MTKTSERKRNPVAFNFILNWLFPIEPVIEPMFGCHAFYVGEKIVLITRKKDQHQTDNGVWVALHPEHVKAIKSEFPYLRSIQLLGNKETLWQNLPADAADFEESLNRICELIRKGDSRIGKIPKARKKKVTRPR